MSVPKTPKPRDQKIYIIMVYLIAAIFFTTVVGLNTREYKACWNVTLTNEDLFCYGGVRWPIDEETYYDQEAIDQIARVRYNAVKDKWLAREKITDQPDNDCLAIARDFFCAASFRRCRDW